MTNATSKNDATDASREPHEIATALSLWAEVTGIDMDASGWRWGELSVREMNDELKESLRLDPSATSTFLMLECFLREYLAQRKFSVAEIMKNYKGLTEYLATAEKLFTMTQSDEVCELGAHFRSQTIEALKRHGADRPEVIAAVNDPDTLPFLRRDALRSLDKLRAYQFLAGPDDPGHPQAIQQVFLAWDVNQLLLSARDMRMSGVALVLLRDPAHANRSYFAFAMRNGDNVILFTDKTQYAHPGQADIVRRPDKAFLARAWQNHFPYQLVKHHYDEDGRIVFDPETGLVQHGVNLAPLADIGTLPPHQAIWIVMMLSLIADRFWKKAWRAETLSYTGAMIKVRDHLITDKSGARLPIAAQYQPIALNPLTRNDVSRDSLAGTIQSETHHNAWIEERYKHRVSELIFNVWTPPAGVALQLPPKGKGNEIEKATDHGHTFGDQPYKLLGFSPSEFGTETELKSDQIWIGRYNLAQQLQKFADEEYEERRKEVHAWYRKQVKANLPFLLEAIAKGELSAKAPPSGFTKSVDEPTERNILRFATLDDEHWKHIHGAGVLLGAMNTSTRNKTTWQCIVTSAVASYRARFTPQMADAVALLAGCAIETLPEVLRHWTSNNHYSGNDILDRLDPVETVLHDPWTKMDLSIQVHLSKRGFGRICKGDYSMDGA